GIAPEELHKVFSSFEQTASGIRSQSGTGLGMAISRSYVNLMGGTLDLRSQQGVGSCFFFHVPVDLVSADEVRASEHPRRVMGLTPGQPTPRILLVDDRDTNLALLQEFLHPLGFETRRAENGLQAVAAYDEWQPHAILMDAAMPEMDGLEATRTIRSREQGEDVVIISISASAFEHDRASILAAGASDFLAKPVREADLLAKLQAHLGLEYEYDSDQPAPETAGTPAELSLAGIEAGLRSQMEEALQCGDLDTLAELADTLDAEHSALAARIQDWSRNFAYDQLNQLFQGALA
ncbi:MAG: response regulator, partial [Candidatus Sericytochromatia bacterium]